MKLTPMQKDVLRQLYAGRGMVHHGYTPGINLPAHTFWDDERGKFWGRTNYNITLRVLRKKGLVETIHAETRGEFEVKLTAAGQEVARGL